MHTYAVVVHTQPTSMPRSKSADPETELALKTVDACRKAVIERYQNEVAKCASPDDEIEGLFSIYGHLSRTKGMQVDAEEDGYDTTGDFIAHCTANETQSCLTINLSLDWTDTDSGKKIGDIVVANLFQVLQSWAWESMPSATYVFNGYNEKHYDFKLAMPKSEIYVFFFPSHWVEMHFDLLNEPDHSSIGMTCMRMSYHKQAGDTKLKYKRDPFKEYSSSKFKWQCLKWPQQGRLYSKEEIARRQELALAFHHRLGKDSHLGKLDDNLFHKIVSDHPITHPEDDASDLLHRVMQDMKNRQLKGTSSCLKCGKLIME